MSFLAQPLLWGLALAGIPVLIHLISRSRYRVRAWGAMRFLSAALRKRSRRLRIEQLLLLALRVLALLLLVLALARPALRGLGGAQDAGPATHVVVLDCSFSTAQGGGADCPFEAAKTFALRLVEAMGPGDNMVVITAGARPGALSARPVFDHQALREAITALKPLDEEADLPRALQAACAALSASTLPRHRIYVLGDLQRHGWRLEDPAAWRLVQGLRAGSAVQPVVYAVGFRPPREPSNLAVLRVQPRSPVVDMHRPARFAVEVANFGEAMRETRVSFLVDGKPRDDQVLRLEPGRRTVHFDAGFPEPGPHRVGVTVGEDDLPVDNRRDLALDVRRTLPVLLVEGRTGGLLDSDGGLLALALEEGRGPLETGLVAVTRKTVLGLEGLGADDLAAYAVVVLADVPSLSGHGRFALERYVERGGGLLAVFGAKTQAGQWAPLFAEGRGLLPALPLVPRELPEGGLAPAIPAGPSAAILDAFDLAGTRVLEDARVRRHWTLRSSTEATALMVLDDQPILAYRAFGKGRAATWGVPADLSWSNLPATPHFLPLLQNLVLRLGSAIQPPINLAQGEALSYEAPPAGLTGTEPCELVLPSGNVQRLPLSFEAGRWTARWSDTSAPGLYTVRLADAARHYAVSLPPAESDLATLSRSERGKAEDLAGLRFVSGFDELMNRLKADAGDRELWRWLMLLALAALALEGLLSWRFSR